MNPHQTLVPPSRLGDLLAEQRAQRGLTVDELRVEAALSFSTAELRQIERGELELTDNQVHRLMGAYEASSGPLVPERSELIVDLHHGAMLAGSRTKVLPPDASLDDVLGRYLSLLYLMRGLEPGEAIALRGGDIEVLADALDRNLAQVEARLFELMVPGEVSPWFGRVRHRLAVPAAGILVGLTTVGALVLVQMPDGERAEILAPETEQAGSVVADDIGLVSAPGGLDAADAELAPAIVAVRGASDEQLIYEPGNPASLGAAALSLMEYDYSSALSDWSITFLAPREGYRGNANTVTRTVSVYVGPHDTPEVVAGVLAHEIGHALDVMYLNDSDREAWMELRGIDIDWWPTSGANDFATGAGDFAEAVAVVIAASPSDSEHGDFTDAQLGFVRDLLP